MGILREMRTALTNAHSAPVGSFPSHQRQMFPQPQMSQQTMGHFTPLVNHQQNQQQPVGLHSTAHQQHSTEHQQPLRFTNSPPYLQAIQQATQQATQQQHSFQWEPASPNASYTSPVDSNME
ncbi:hypothetical protein PPYR_02142 [Photinus pyralis]|uniref:Uncharacterized protein n=1 Tax=Photinus pyralis TaxID=7054 RepID=A0A5N4B6E5_PHOPY|nr:hypothetical protein PPYR_02142 [Photinus pyralis]